MNQLSIFDQILSTSANNLIDALNDGRKPKEKFEPDKYIQIGNLIVLSASSKDLKVFNCLDGYGNTPDGFSACWRSQDHIISEIFEK